ncbi:PEP-CTERM sorting domain-containing protein [Aerosakkonema funiforme]|uniref:PEP-CTERM sorting domain-containing protein n=2 Tax=Oscillatoriophycideae TaxID=1301283 RepID=A0A926VM50_9CYAN|nr:PEP-CTERM sorting domain-containing protein [Aerosakkonema funiforme]MBD2186315.1 PEP-CTERM sorting domain-containing protein [Aerosakkonema funiforme FACHB-1375]
MKIATKAAFALPISLIVTSIAALPSLAGTLTYATKVEFYNNKGTPMDAYRTDTDNALGAPQIDQSNNSNKDFLSLGIKGEAIFSFGTLFAGQVTLWETTWGNYTQQSQYDEQVQVFVGNDLNGSNWLDIGTIKNITDNAFKNPLGATLNINNNNTYKYVKLIDKSPAGSGRDGFDVNAIAVMGVETASVPEPASALSLLALGAFGTGSVLKRKQQKS